MSTIKSFSVGNGDMFYIDHSSDNFSIIDCNLDIDNKESIMNEICKIGKEKGIMRFISTHPDEDHFHGIEYFDEKLERLDKAYSMISDTELDLITKRTRKTSGESAIGGIIGYFTGNKED